MARWEQSKASLNKGRELKKRIDDLELQAERALRDGDFEAAAQLRFGEIPTLQARLAEVSTAAAAPMANEEAGPDDVGGVISAWTGIPAGRLLEGETG